MSLRDKVTGSADYRQGVGCPFETGQGPLVTGQGSRGDRVGFEGSGSSVKGPGPHIQITKQFQHRPVAKPDKHCPYVGALSQALGGDRSELGRSESRCVRGLCAGSAFLLQPHLETCRTGRL